MKPVVVILGRPNVGKSSLFNYFAGKRRAIVEDEPGVTRDLLYAEVSRGGRDFWLVDSGGYEADDREELAAEIRAQLDAALAEADVILFLMDALAGPNPVDAEIVSRLRRQDRPVLYVVNKADSERIERDATLFFELGIERYIPISAKSGRGLRALTDALLSALPEQVEEEPTAVDEAGACRIAIVGRPNVGKSSLVNALVGMRRVIVSETPGTTRDAVDVPFEYAGDRYVLIDTAGLRRKSRVRAQVETYSAVRALSSLSRCDVALVVLDGSQEAAAQDERIAGYVQEHGCGCVLVVNKWDLAERGAGPLKEYEREIRNRFGYLAYAPLLFVSARTGKGIDKIMSAAIRVHANRRRRVPTAQLNEWLARTLATHTPPLHLGRRLKIFYMTQTKTAPPTFVGFANYPEAIHFSYQRYLVNGLRELADFDGSPLRLEFRQRSEDRFPKKKKRPASKGRAGGRSSRGRK